MANKIQPKRYYVLHSFSSAKGDGPASVATYIDRPEGHDTWDEAVAEYLKELNECKFIVQLVPVAYKIVPSQFGEDGGPRTIVLNKED